jgi:5-(carboxyamino)imidazole ribonucleotide mutase
MFEDSKESEKIFINMKKPIVGIIMGSDSDLPMMQEAAKILEQFDIPFEVTIVSAHRTPERMYAYAKSATKRGLQTIIACAGGAVHLPGIVASLTPIPVIGVPRQLKSLGGLDSLLSIVQMPPGIPVATVTIDGAKNAGLLAARIIGANNKELQTKLEKFQKDLSDTVTQKAEKMEELGYQKYLDQYKKEK